jgi:adenine-specific DNA-methyltransferase
MNKQLTTKNISASNNDLEVLKKNFPQCFDKNGNFDFEKFKQELSKNDNIDFSNESYGMDWLGKSYARLLASDEATTLLKENADWNKKAENKNSENLLIKGDNLEVLKHLSNAYYEKIKMIYIDPPYNTGGDGFVYQDDRKFSVEELSKLAGIDEDKAKRILEFTQSKSNSHSAWLAFMYPRLYIAKQLLKDDGVIFASIDDNEVAQLRLLMDEIFGEENFVAEVIWRKKKAYGRGDQYIIPQTEYILTYRKSEKLKPFGIPVESESIIKRYKYEDDKGKYELLPLWHKSPNGPYKRPTLQYELILDGKKIDSVSGQFLWKKDRIVKEYKNNCVEIVKFNGKYRVYSKSYLDFNSEGEERTTTPISYFDGATTSDSAKELMELFEDKIFDFSKPVKLIKHFLRNISFDPNDIILDFFAGSGTTGDAVMRLNTEDKTNGKEGNRKYILVQLPEPIDPKRNKTAYDFVKNELKIEKPTVFDITKERLIRAGKKIQEDNKKSKESKDLSDVDFGFKIFETASIWEDYNLEAGSFDPQTKLFDESKLSKEDLKTLLTTWKTYDGFSLAQDFKEIDLDGYKGHYFDNKLYLVDKGFETKHLKKLLEEIDENEDFNPATIIVFGYNFQSKMLREIADNVKNYTNKKYIDIDFITRY